MKKAIYVLLSATLGVLLYSAGLLEGMKMLVYFVCFLIGAVIA